MDIATHLDTLEREGQLLLEAATSAGLDAAVPTCAPWQVRDLVQHVGQVHRWALSYVGTGRATPPDETDQPAAPPADDQLLEWFRDGHAELLKTLQSAPDDLQCWAFLPAPSPRAFWARRQAHETAIHRADAQRAAGDEPSYDARFAADGIEELLFGFFARARGRLVSDPPVRLGLRAADTADAWTMTIAPDSRTAARDAGDGDCVVTGPAAHLYLLLWNRGGVDQCRVDGDIGVLELWHDKAKISWR
jgi:uncharacterized protein (TIGR03083 family)